MKGIIFFCLAIICGFHVNVCNKKQDLYFVNLQKKDLYRSSIPGNNQKSFSFGISTNFKANATGRWNPGVTTRWSWIVESSVCSCLVSWKLRSSLDLVQDSQAPGQKLGETFFPPRTQRKHPVAKHNTVALSSDKSETMIVFWELCRCVFWTPRCLAVEVNLVMLVLHNLVMLVIHITPLQCFLHIRPQCPSPGPLWTVTEKGTCPPPLPYRTLRTQGPAVDRGGETDMFCPRDFPLGLIQSLVTANPNSPHSLHWYPLWTVTVNRIPAHPSRSVLCFYFDVL